MALNLQFIETAPRHTQHAGKSNQYIIATAQSWAQHCCMFTIACNCDCMWSPNVISKCPKIQLARQYKHLKRTISKRSVGSPALAPAQSMGAAVASSISNLDYVPLNCACDTPSTLPHDDPCEVSAGSLMHPTLQSQHRQFINE